jgi:predicted metal-dependent hydrolase
MTQEEYLQNAKKQLATLIKQKATYYKSSSKSNYSINDLIKKLENKKNFMANNHKVIEQKANELYKGYVELFGEDANVAKSIIKYAGDYLSKTIAEL